MADNLDSMLNKELSYLLTVLSDSVGIIQSRAYNLTRERTTIFGIGELHPHLHLIQASREGIPPDLRDRLNGLVNKIIDREIEIVLQLGLNIVYIEGDENSRIYNPFRERVPEHINVVSLDKNRRHYEYNALTQRQTNRKYQKEQLARERKWIKQISRVHEDGALIVGPGHLNPNYDEDYFQGHTELSTHLPNLFGLYGIDFQFFIDLVPEFKDESRELSELVGGII